MKWKLLLYIAAAYLILHIPFVGQYLRAANTMVHESGHAIVALLMKGEVKDISLFINTEGVTRATSASFLGGLLTGIAGYIFSALVIVVLAYFWRNRRYRLIYGILLAFALADLIFWVRNWYGIFWLVIFIILLFVLLKIRNPKTTSALSLILLIILLAGSIRSGMDIFMLGLFHPSYAGDAAYLSQLTHVPALIWGTAFLVITVLLAYSAFRNLAKPKRHSADRKNFSYETDRYSRRTRI